eukprot:maker-scaffold298_size217389-snap-gene-1.19 protein:Tk12579 transcript:maker-scaffold298_size217389-snap-gene-1.19-mRNA-1 annotation:"protein ddi1 homolog 2 isoform x1"
MLLTVTCPSTDSVFPITISDDMEVENVKALCEAETGQPMDQFRLRFQGRELADERRSLTHYGVRDGDMLVWEAKARPPAAGLQLPDFSRIRLPGASAARERSAPPSGRGPEDPRVIFEMLRTHPETLAVLRHNNPSLAEAFDSGRVAEFERVLKAQTDLRVERERQRQRLLQADPLDLEAQRLIAQEIAHQNIEQNMELAMEHNPEAFGTVIMLYIHCRVNGHPIQAFVDSGAQATIMSQAAAEKCGIMRLVDKRWAGVAKGVGTQKILGRVHLAQIQIENDYLSSSFSILEEQPMDMLLGLDMLKRHQCCIDLRRNLLVIGSSGTETPFLAEADLPECAKLSSKMLDMDQALKESSQDHEKLQLEEALAQSQDEAKRIKVNDGAGPSSTLGLSSGLLPADQFTESDVQKLMGYGFARDQCLSELRSSHGDVEQATAALLAKSLKF